MKHFDAIIIGTGLPGPSLAARLRARTRQSPSWTGPRRGRCANTCIRSNLHSALESDRYVVGEKSPFHQQSRSERNRLFSTVTLANGKNLKPGSHQGA
jgi:hypothetical protein